MRELDRQLNLNEAVLRTKVLRPERTDGTERDLTVCVPTRQQTTVERPGVTPMAAGDTQITIVGNLVDDPELRYTPTGAAGGAVPGGLHAEVPRQEHERVEGRRQPVPDLQRVAAGGGERGREPAARHAGDRLGAAAAALVRDQGRREAHRVRGRGRRRRPFAAERLGQGQPDPPGPAAAAATAAAVTAAARRRLRAAAAPAARAAQAAAHGGGGSSDPWATDGRRAAVTPTNRPSNETPARAYRQPTIPAAARGSERSTTMAKPPLRKPKKKVCAVLPGEERPTSTTRTPVCCASSSPTAARSAPGG